MAEKKYGHNPRRVQAYLRPRSYMIFLAEQKMLLRGESEHVARIIEQHHEAMPESKQRALLEYYHKFLKTK